MQHRGESLVHLTGMRIIVMITALIPISVRIGNGREFVALRIDRTLVQAPLALRECPGG
jgi:hypothetical protein